MRFHGVIPSSHTVDVPQRQQTRAVCFPQHHVSMILYVYYLYPREQVCCVIEQRLMDTTKVNFRIPYGVLRNIAYMDKGVLIHKVGRRADIVDPLC
jgi:hypothetical protein